MAGSAGLAESGPGPWSLAHSPAHRLAHDRVRLAAGAPLDDPAWTPADRWVALVWQEQPRRASGGECGGARRARARAPGACRLQDLVATHVGADEEPGRAGAHRLLRVHELRVLPAGELVVPLPRAGAALHGAGKRMAGQHAAARGRHRLRCRRRVGELLWEALR